MGQSPQGCRRSSTAPKIGILAERRYMSQAQPAGVMTALAERGYDVELVDPDAAVCRFDNRSPTITFDAVVARGRSLMLLLLLSHAERQGTPTINRSASIRAVLNKAHMSMVLAAEGLPIPRTFVGPIALLPRNLNPGVDYPLILKPVFGDNAKGIEVVESARELTDLAWPDPTVLAQHFLPSDSYDLKLYGIGADVWAVRKPSPLPHAAMVDDAELVSVTPAMQRLAQTCRAAFDLDLYGVDCLESSRGLVVIEVNDFPNYSAVPDADRHLADYIAAHCLDADGTPASDKGRVS